MVIMSFVLVQIAIGLLVFGSILEFATLKTVIYKYKKFVGITLIIMYTFSGLLLLNFSLNIATLLFSLLVIYRIINCLRLVESRMHKEYLKQSASRTLIVLTLLQVVVLLVWWQADLYNNISNTQLFYTYSIAAAIVSLTVLFSTSFNIINSKPRKTQNFSDKELPTVTLAIPARNENHILTACLTEALKSNYPKLEILVLDDCSQDKTAEVIKSFAHNGVRFVQGMQPNDTWLAKNSAYQILLEQASGDLIMFMGVDVRLNENSIKNAVDHYLCLNVKMMSIMPKRQKSGLLAAFIQPTRYWWELAVPKLFLKRPPVLSTCWIIDRASLQKMGGFKSISRSIIPEEKLAKMFSKSKSYAFLRTDKLLPLFTQKDFTSQWATAVRTRYPQTHRRPEQVAIRTLLILCFIIAPFIILPLIPFVNGSNFIINFLIITACTLFIFSHIFIALITNPISAIIAVVNFPFVMAIDLIATHISMYRYEFGEVIWKGRNVTTAAMHVVPHLPDIDDKPILN